MKRFLKMIRVEWLIAAFCAWHSTDLIQAWRHSPYERFGWVALILWLVPAARVVGRGPAASGQFALAVISLLLAFVGVIGGLNLLVYCGLAGIVGAIAGVSGRAWLWLALAVCWMPAFSWFCSKVHFPPHAAQVLRLLIASLAAGLGLRWLTPAAPKPPV